MSLDGFKILTAVLCEETRQEASGRAIIIGAMGHGPAVSDEEDTPINRLAVYLEIQMPPDRMNLKLRLINSDQEEPAMQVNVDTSEMYDSIPDTDTDFKNSVAVVIFGREGFSLRGSGYYEVQYATEEDNWQKYREFYFPLLVD